MAGETTAQTTAADAVDNPREVKYPAVAVIARDIKCFSSGGLELNVPPIPPGHFYHFPISITTYDTSIFYRINSGCSNRWIDGKIPLTPSTTFTIGSLPCVPHVP